jgi:hypothetical protein
MDVYKMRFLPLLRPLIVGIPIPMRMAEALVFGNQTVTLVTIREYLSGALWTRAGGVPRGTRYVN